MIGEIELELVEDVEEVDEFICHLYVRGWNVSYCGIHSSDDPHALMHMGYRQKSPQFTQSEGAQPICPACGAKVCDKCYAIAERLKCST